ncbi:TPA: restriction endonuclease subunit S [Acinetobacter baumannii]|nr:restriction endonuclease subunit S [Acinetobacter baumannii]KAB1608510.1 restriction endonuclease subunit S [Acinetobacter baumannii]HEO1845838.1 restriction endonuclease subunit S [Acinetobacter baumannii]
MAAPKLRFKGFDEDWTAKKLSQVANLTSSKRVHLSDYVSEGIPFFRGKEITELKSGIFPKDILYISKKQYEDFKEKFGAPQNNEILMTAVGTLANTYLINTDFEFYFKDGNLIWIKDINADPNFLMILLDARKNDVLASAIGSTQKALTIANLNKLIFNFPSNEEQTKIASFLSAVDEKISQLTQKHALLTQYKQGMMQKLFSQEIRFKADDGSEFGEWENKPLSELSEKAMYGMNASATEYDGLNKYLRITDICEISHKLKRDNLTSPNAELEEKYKLGYGDLLFARTGASVGKSYLYSVDDGIAYFAGFLIKFSLKLDLVNPYFLFAQTLTLDFDKWVITNSMRSGQPGINAEEYSSYIFKVPCLEEQTKIANFLSAIDQKIEGVAQQIEQAKQWKKGLLQQMFI